MEVSHFVAIYVIVSPITATVTVPPSPVCASHMNKGYWSMLSGSSAFSYFTRAPQVKINETYKGELIIINNIASYF